MPLIAAIVWGAFGRTGLGAGFAAAVVANAALMVALGQ
jgi:hypothetical protein